jgi:uncharacterized RmlC-like cupin family protein
LISGIVEKLFQQIGDDMSKEDKIITVRPKETINTRQQLPNFEGISAATAGATGLCMHLVIIPPGGKAVPHLHKGYETAIYILKGRAETRYGDGLLQSEINEAGDFIFIPADVPHQPVNLSDTDEVVAVVARNDPNEQESVVLYDPNAQP